MPKFDPITPGVDWPDCEGTLGIVGVAPWATIDFCRAFYGLISVTKDWQYPRVIIDNNTKIPSRGRHLELGEQDPSPMIQQTIQELAKMGATVVVVPCNTAHILYERWSNGTSIPIPNIVDATLAHVKELGVQKICPAVSTSLSQFDLYGFAIERAGLECRRLDNQEQVLISQAISEIKLEGNFGETTFYALEKFADKLLSNGVDSVLLGCTELSGAAQLFAAKGITPIDSNEALALAALRLLKLSPERIRDLSVAGEKS